MDPGHNTRAIDYKAVAAVQFRRTGDISRMLFERSNAQPASSSGQDDTPYRGQINTSPGFPSLRDALNLGRQEQCPKAKAHHRTGFPQAGADSSVASRTHDDAHQVAAGYKSSTSISVPKPARHAVPPKAVPQMPTRPHPPPPKPATAAAPEQGLPAPSSMIADRIEDAYAAKAALDVFRLRKTMGPKAPPVEYLDCLLYTSDAADE